MKKKLYVVLCVMVCVMFTPKIAWAQDEMNYSDAKFMELSDWKQDENVERWESPTKHEKGICKNEKMKRIAGSLATITTVVKRGDHDNKERKTKIDKIYIFSTINGRMYLGSSAEFKAVTESEEEVVSWKVDNPRIASIDAQGHLEAKQIGKTEVIAYTEYGKEARYEIEIVAVPSVIVQNNRIVEVYRQILTMRLQQKC